MKIFALNFSDLESGTQYLFYNHGDLKEDECRRIVSEHLVAAYKAGHAKELKNLHRHAKHKSDAEVFGWMIEDMKKRGGPLQFLVGRIGKEILWKHLKSHGLELIEPDQNIFIREWDHLRQNEDSTWSLISHDKGRVKKETFLWWWRKLNK